MNTAIQTKTHTPKSAKGKQQHNERKDNSIKNPKIVILQKNHFHKFHQKEPIQKPKTTAKLQAQEQALKKELATIQSKINTYNKRVEEYASRKNPNIARIEKLKEQIKDLELQKEKIPKLNDNRGKPQKVKYVEFELSLTNSNHLKQDKQVQKAFYEAFKELQKDEIFKDLKSISQIMHLDQESLHIHNINKLANGKSWNSIVESQKLPNDKDGREVYSRLQNKFNNIVRKNLKELEIEIEPQQKGIKYLPLKKYKEKTNFKSQDQKEEEKKAFKQRLEEIKEKYVPPQPPQPPQPTTYIKSKEEELEELEDHPLVQQAMQTRNQVNSFDIEDVLKNGLKKEDNEEKKEEKKEPNQAQIELKKMSLKKNDLSTFKQVQEQNREKKEEKINTKKHYKTR